MDPQLDANRRSWDERVGIHSRSAFYDVEGWLAAERMPRDEERAAFGEVTGKSLVQLQCHFGMDTLQFARAGASVTGVDFSAPAIAEATALAERAGLAARSRFVCSDVTEAPALLGGERFDVAYVSLGSLCWLPAIAAWGQVVADVLAPGGLFYLFDVHPLAQSLDDERQLRHLLVLRRARRAPRRLRLHLYRRGARLRTARPTGGATPSPSPSARSPQPGSRSTGSKSTTGPRSSCSSGSCDRPRTAWCSRRAGRASRSQ